MEISMFCRLLACAAALALAGSAGAQSAAQERKLANGLRVIV